MIQENFNCPGMPNVRNNNIFVLTGMNDMAWWKQTRERLEGCVDSTNVQFQARLKTVAESLRRRFAKSRTLQDLLFFVDESHIASNSGNMLAKHVYTTIVDCVPVEKWAEHNIRFVTISATDPAKDILLRELKVDSAKTGNVRLETSSAYRSLIAMRGSGHLKFLGSEFPIITDKETCVAKFVSAVESHYEEPKYHFVRPKCRMGDGCIAHLRTMRPEWQTIKWDGATRAESKKRARKDDDSSIRCDDINEILCDAPEMHTVIVLKNMFYAAKTLDDTHIGFMWDRKSSADDTNLQSLPGRACGYGKKGAPIIITSKSSYDNYDNYWRHHDCVSRIEAASDDERLELSGRMKGLEAHRDESESDARVVMGATASYQVPMGTSEGGIRVTKKGLRAEDLEKEKRYKVFATLGEANAFRLIHRMTRTVKKLTGTKELM